MVCKYMYKFDTVLKLQKSMCIVVNFTVKIKRPDVKIVSMNII